MTGATVGEQPSRVAQALRQAGMAGRTSAKKAGEKMCIFFYVRERIPNYECPKKFDSHSGPDLSAVLPSYGMVLSARPCVDIMETARPGSQPSRGRVPGYRAGLTGAKAAITDAVEGVQARRFVCECRVRTNEKCQWGSRTKPPP